MEDTQTSNNAQEHTPLIIKPSEETIPEQDELQQIKGFNFYLFWIWCTFW